MPDTIEIAIVGPKTGPLAEYGDMQRIGALQAVKDINAGGGVDGRMLEAKEYDDGAEPTQAVAVAGKVVDDGVKFVVGHVTSAATQRAANVYEEAGVVMITPAATSSGITAVGHELVFRTVGADVVQSQVAAEYIVDHVEPEAVAVLHDKSLYGMGLAAVVEPTLEEKGVAVPVSEGVDAAATDFSAIIEKLKENSVDFVYWGGYHPALGLILRQARAQGLGARFMAADACATESISRIAQGASEGLLVTVPKAFDADPANKAVVDAIKEAGGDPGGTFVLPAYSAVRLIAEGVRKAGSEDTHRVAEALYAGTFSTPTGDLGFDESGDLKDGTFVVHEWHFGAPKTEASPQ
ncbi:ABC transporter substrate-binding protein [Kitasatospora sp. NPDC004799]|uniref:ABC transporter substrate-binding protein n=1 Tax=Kitasatospora sp. NPDC004799 TaxID=3154460 RepID=UPI0033BED00E